mgnify:CR=1 FL=1
MLVLLQLLLLLILAEYYTPHSSYILREKTAFVCCIIVHQ